MKIQSLTFVLIAFVMLSSSILITDTFSSSESHQTESSNHNSESAETHDTEAPTHDTEAPTHGTEVTASTAGGSYAAYLASNDKPSQHSESAETQHSESAETQNSESTEIHKSTSTPKWTFFGLENLFDFFNLK